jgi:hypothetical protein
VQATCDVTQKLLNAVGVPGEATHARVQEVDGGEADGLLFQGHLQAGAGLTAAKGVRPATHQSKQASTIQVVIHRAMDMHWQATSLPQYATK